MTKILNISEIEERLRGLNMTILSKETRLTGFDKTRRLGK